MEDEVERGLLALLGDAVGDEFYSGNFVVLAGEDGDGEGREVVEYGGGR